MTASRWLGFLASPSFALLALASVIQDSGASTLCSAMPTSSLGGMTLMYGLMSLFRAPPWLRLTRGA